MISREDQEKAALWHQRIQEQQESGLSIRAWCLEKQLRVNRFFYWKRRLFQNPENEIQFIELPKEVKVAPEWSEERFEAPIHIQYCNFRVLVGISASQEQLLTVLNALQQSC